MDFESLVSGQLLEISLIVFAAGILLRTIFFVSSVIRSEKFRKWKWKHAFKTIFRSLFPLHRSIKKKPLYTLLRSLFHICLFGVPIFLAGHIVLWESSGLQLSWPPIPDALADWMTIIFITLSVLFIIRRIALTDLRKNSTAGDYLLIIVGASTFLSGYFLAHGTLDSIPFFLQNIETIHILCGETLFILTAVLFLQSRLDQKRCTGCAACETSCPTGTLESRQTGSRRVFFYSHYLCISCGACVNACPENAAALKHQINLKRLLQISIKREIRSVELTKCRLCGTFFSPEPQLLQVREKISEDYIYSCPKCRMIQSAEAFRRLLPGFKPPKA